MLSLSVQSKTLLRILVAVTAGLAVISVVSDVLYLGFGRGGLLYETFDLNREGNVPTWWAALQVGMLAMLCFDLARRGRRRTGGRPVAWTVFGLAMLYVSADEVARLHERATPVFNALSGRDEGIFRFGWVFIALPVVVAFALVMVPLLLSLSRSVALQLIVGGAVFVVGAAVLEVVGGSLVSAGWSKTSFPYVLEYTLEETCELLGMVIAFHAVARHASRGVQTHDVVLDDQRARVAS